MRQVWPLLISLVLPLAPARAEPLPDLAAFKDRLQRTEALADKAQHVGAVAMRMQNILTEQIYTQQLRCDDVTSSLLARERHLGHVYRDLLQAWRVEVARLQEERQAPTVAPLVLKDDHKRLEDLLVSLNNELGLWTTLAAWQQSRIEPWAGVCPAQLVPDRGLEDWRAQDTRAEKVLVIGAGPGRLCPVGVPAAGAVVLVDGEACYAGAECDCTPVPVQDGAVLGEGT